MQLFDRLPVSNAVLKIGTELNLLMELSVIIIETTTVKLIKKQRTSIECILRLTYTTPSLNWYKLRSNYKFYVFDLSKQKDHFASQPNRLELDSANKNVADYTAYFLVLTSS